MSHDWLLKCNPGKLLIMTAVKQSEQSCDGYSPAKERELWVLWTWPLRVGGGGGGAPAGEREGGGGGLPLLGASECVRYGGGGGASRVFRGICAGTGGAAMSFQNQLKMINNKTNK